MIGIRADANNIIATGHMMRCITIARAVVMQGESVTFFMADNESERLFKSFGGSEFSGVVLGTDYKDMDGELDILEKELREKDIRILLVDSYSVTKEYFERLSKICPVAYLDDLAKDAYSADVVINYSGYSIKMGYEQLYDGVRGYSDHDTKLLLGLQYAPLREQFYEAVSEEPGSNTGVGGDDRSIDSGNLQNRTVNVLLATGGSDMCNMITCVLDKAPSMSAAGTHSEFGEGPGDNILWHVVVGDFVENPEAIENCAKGRKDVVLHRSVKNMAELMRECDVAVLAAGTMLTECAAVRLPAIFYQVADNQKFNVEYFSALEGMRFAGEVHTGAANKEETIDKIFEELGRLLGDKTKLRAMGESLSEITDGRGAIRIAEALMEEIR